MRTWVPRDDNRVEARATTRVLVSGAKATEVAEAEAVDSNADRGNHLREVSSRAFLHHRILEASPFHHCLPHRCRLPTRLRRMVS